MESVASLMLSEGVSEAKIASAIKNGLGVASKAAVDTQVPAQLYLALSALLHGWHQHSAFLDPDARPIALTLRGPRKSIQALAAASGVKIPIEKLVDSLKLQNLIRRVQHGKYEPTSALAQLKGNGPEISGYLGHAIFNLLETIEVNRTDPKKFKSLLERAAIVQDLPVREAAKFRKFSAEQGANLVSNASAWLESRRQRPKSGRSKAPTVTAGLHIFTFVSKASSDS